MELENESNCKNLFGYKLKVALANPIDKYSGKPQ